MAARRLLDAAIAAAALAAASPLLAVAALGIRLTSPGPVLYRAARVGLGGRRFTMLKFRTMHEAGAAHGSRITSAADPRVFAFGAWLRRWKVDELPQLVNVLRGEMALVGPRPEDPEIVDMYYTAGDRETLGRLPGLASPGSIYNYTHGERLIAGGDPELAYASRLLPVKLALDRVYVRNASLLYDARVLLRTARVIAALALGRSGFPEPPEMSQAQLLLRSEERAPRARRGAAAGRAAPV